MGHSEPTPGPELEELPSTARRTEGPALAPVCLVTGVRATIYGCRSQPGDWRPRDGNWCIGPCRPCLTPTPTPPPRRGKLAAADLSSCTRTALLYLTNTGIFFAEVVEWHRWLPQLSLRFCPYHTKLDSHDPWVWSNSTISPLSSFLCNPFPRRVHLLIGVMSGSEFYSTVRQPIPQKLAFLGNVSLQLTRQADFLLCHLSMCHGDGPLPLEA